MAVKVTINELKRWQANPPEKRTYVSDAVANGLQIRLNTDASISFCARRRRNGKREWKTFGKWPEVGLAEARQMAREWVTGADVETPKEVAFGRATWGDIVQSYVEEVRVTNKSWENQRHLLTNYIPRQWWHRPAESITKAELKALFLRIGRKAPYQANRVKATVSAAFNRGIEDDLVQTNPVQGMRRLFKEKPRKNILDFEQLRTLWQACAAHDYPASRAIQLLILTGARRGEILNARWDDLGSDHWLNVEENKADRPHKIYLSDLAWDIVNSLASREVSEYLFPGPSLDAPVKDIKMSKRTLARHADIGTWQLRDLRSTFLSHSVEHCGTLPVVAKACANHEIPGITDHNYIERTAYYPACKEAWIQYGRLVAGIVQGHAGRVLSMPSARVTS